MLCSPTEFIQWFGEPKEWVLYFERDGNDTVGVPFPREWLPLVQHLRHVLHFEDVFARADLYLRLQGADGRAEAGLGWVALD